MILRFPCPWIKMEFPCPLTEVSSSTADSYRPFAHKFRRLSIEKRTTASLEQVQHISMLFPMCVKPKSSGAIYNQVSSLKLSIFFKLWLDRGNAVIFHRVAD